MNSEIKLENYYFDQKKNRFILKYSSFNLELKKKIKENINSAKDNILYK
jgi:hypothetical protein